MVLVTDAARILWRRPGATALIQPLDWEPPYAAVALKRQKKKKKKKKKTEKIKNKKLHINKAL